MKNRFINMDLNHCIHAFCIVTAIFLLCPKAHAQSILKLHEEMTVDFSKTKIDMTDFAKKARASKRSGGGVISLNNVNDTPVANKVMASIEVAADIWRDYLPFGDSLRINLYFEDNLDADIEMDILYQSVEGKEYLYPSALARKLFKGDSSSDYDADIHINTAVNWSFGVGKAHAFASKNLTLAFMQVISKCLGFGSSVSLSQDGIDFSKSHRATIFDSYVTGKNGEKLVDYLHNSNGLQQFATGMSGNVYFLSDAVTAKLYTPSTFDTSLSLKCTYGENSLMDYSKGNINTDLVIDDLTLNILNVLGWNISASDQPFHIVSDDIDNTGITSAYTSHSFHISQTSTDLTGYNWKLVLPLAGGSSTVYSSSDNSTFTIPSISNPELYEHTIEGDIRGMILFEGIANGNGVSASYPITLELKPHIISASVVSRNVCSSNPNYFDAVVEIKYEGSYYVDAFVEEEYSPYLMSYSSSTPYYTHLYLKDVLSLGGAWCDITVRNEYGSDNYVLDLSDNTAGIGFEGISGNTTTSHIEVYDMQGKFIGQYKSTEELPKGFYVLKYYNNANICYKKIKRCVK